MPTQKSQAADPEPSDPLEVAREQIRNKALELLFSAIGGHFTLTKS
jgi:hypothetical protein